MSELSERSGVAIPSIKFYLREGLLPAGVRTSPNQSDYTEAHVERLRLIRALTDVGGLAVASARDVLAAIDADIPLDWAFGIAQRAASSPTSVDSAPTPAAIATIDGLVSELGWSAMPDNPGRAMVARVLSSYDDVGQSDLKQCLPAYARAAEIVAEADLASVGRRLDRASMTETVVVGTVLGDTLFAGLRRIAQENISHHLYSAPVEAPKLESEDAPS